MQLLYPRYQKSSTLLFKSTLPAATMLVDKRTQLSPHQHRWPAPIQAIHLHRNPVLDKRLPSGSTRFSISKDAARPMVLKTLASARNLPQRPAVDCGGGVDNGASDALKDGDSRGSPQPSDPHAAFKESGMCSPEASPDWRKEITRRIEALRVFFDRLELEQAEVREGHVKLRDEHAKLAAQISELNADAAQLTASTREFLLYQDYIQASQLILQFLEQRVHRPTLHPMRDAGWIGWCNRNATLAMLLQGLGISDCYQYQASLLLLDQILSNRDAVAHPPGCMTTDRMIRRMERYQALGQLNEEDKLVLLILKHKTEIEAASRVYRMPHVDYY